MIAGIVIAGLVLLTVFWAVGAYQRLVGQRNGCRHAFAQIDPQLKRRHVVIASLIDAARGRVGHERGMLDALVAAQGRAVADHARAALDPMNAAAVRDMATSEVALSAALGQLFALAAADPSFKADADMAPLTDELSGTENRIAIARQVYNDSVAGYNTAIGQFPGAIVARLCAFKSAEALPPIDTPRERRAARAAS